MTDTATQPAAHKIMLLVGEYWSLAHAEGKEGRTHDTPAGDAQRVLIAINDAVQSQHAEIERLKALDVTQILVDIVPGDGSGFEVYAKSIQDVENKLGSMGEELEDWQLGIKRYPHLVDQLATAQADLARVRQELICALERENVAKADVERMDHLDQNIFSREHLTFDGKVDPDKWMWVTFAPKGVQGSARAIIDAAINQLKGDAI